MMTTQSPDPAQTYMSSDKADAWERAKSRRQETTGAATEMMLDLAGVRPGDRVLEVAAGTGDLSIMAARRVGSSGHVLATDISAAMLDRAAQAARAAGVTNIETRVMNAADLALQDNSFDAVLCRMALMLFPQPLQTLVSMRRVVKQGRKIAVMVHSAAAKNPYHGLPLEIVRRIGKITPPPPDEPGMFALGGPGVLDGMLEKSGLRKIQVSPLPLQRKFPSLADAIQSMKSNAALQHLLGGLSADEQNRAWTEIEQAMRPFQKANDFEAPGEVLVAVGTK